MNKKLKPIVIFTKDTNNLETNEPFVAASRGRNPENPSDRTVGVKTEQRLEFNLSGNTNTLTTVQKDNYIVQSKNQSENIWVNDLIKYDIDNDKIRIFDAFAGKGALHKSLKKLGVKTNLIALSEVAPDPIIAYAAVHIDNFLDKEFDYPNVEYMREFLINRRIGWDFEKQKSSIPRMKVNKLKLLYKATILTNNLGDISAIDYEKIEDFDLFNLSFPCTDISVSGKQTGLSKEDGTHTRSGLIKFGLQAIRAKKPKLILIENVKNLIGKKFINDFYSIIKEIEDYGYVCHYPYKDTKNYLPKCLNAKDYGIPQNRERIFVFCVRDDLDVGYDFPIGFDSGIRLKHILENNIDEKYYLNEEIQKRFKLNGKKDINHNELNVVGSSAPECRTIGQRDMTYGINGIMSTLTATDYKQPKQIVDRIGGCFDKDGKTHQAGSVYSKNGLSPTITTCEGGYRMPIIEDYNQTKQIITEGNYSPSRHNASRVVSTEGISPTVMENHGTVTAIIDRLNKDECVVCEQRSDEGLRFFKDNICGSLRTIDACGDKRIIEDNRLMEIGSLDIKGFEQSKRVYDKNGLSPTVTTCRGGSVHPKILDINLSDYKIRKLSPKECWRLMGFDDEDFDNAKSTGLSDSALYKLAGNSIVVNCLYYIFKNYFKKEFIPLKEL